MDIYLKACGGVMIALVMTLSLGNVAKEMASLLTVAVCAMVCLTGLRYFREVTEFIRELTVIGQLNGDLIEILLKITGIGIISELAALICADSGSSSLGKSLQLLGSLLILWLSLPVFTVVLELIQTMLGDL